MKTNEDSSCRFCCGCPPGGLTRRGFLAGVVTTGGVAVSPLRSAPAPIRAAARQQPIRLPLTVQPVLVYQIYERKEITSWRPWSGIHTEQDAERERERIGAELSALRAKVGFPLEVLPVASARTPEEGVALARGGHDVMLMYGASGGLGVLEALTLADRWNLLFLRHRSGPAYLWYEIAHPRFLRKTVDEFTQPGIDVHELVVDNYDEILMRLRAFYALKNTLGKRIVAVGGPGGWGVGGREAPNRAREMWKLDIRTVSYDDLGERIRTTRENAGLVRRSHAETERYLRQRGVSLHTSKQAVSNAFLLCEVFRDLLDEASADAITIRGCMGTIIPISETTTCLPLTLLNDEGYLAFCESDFVVIPSGILLHYISGRPVFLNNPTYPYEGVVTQAHCTAPRRMDGERLEPARIMTHMESDYGAAPKVEMRKGQRVTNLIPDFSGRRWVGFEGEIIDNPFLDICRSQIDVRIFGDTNLLLERMGGFHWMTAYGSHLREAQYALRKAGVELLTLGRESG